MRNGRAQLPILSSIAAVVSRCSHVFFHPELVRPAVEEWGDYFQGLGEWQNVCHFFDDSEETVRWIFVLDILNHCFWPDVGKPTWTIHYGGSPRSGYWGLAAGLKRAQESGIPITQPNFLANLSADDLKGIFSGNVEIPLLEERLFSLREAGRILNSTWQGDIIHLLESAKGNAVVAVKEIVNSFPSFRDEARYGEIKVYFWKRAQIFISDVNLAFAGRKWGKFIHMDKLTAFADYKLPQVLRELGVISYHPDLARKVDSMQVLPQGCEEEIEIRAMTVWVVEALKNAFAAQGREVSSTWVDNWLWQLGQMESFRKRPYHRCRTIFY